MGIRKLLPKTQMQEAHTVPFVQSSQHLPFWINFIPLCPVSLTSCFLFFFSVLPPLWLLLGKADAKNTPIKSELFSTVFVYWCSIYSLQTKECLWSISKLGLYFKTLFDTSNATDVIKVRRVAPPFVKIWCTAVRSEKIWLAELRTGDRTNLHRINFKLKDNKTLLAIIWSYLHLFRITAWSFRTKETCDVSRIKTH